MRFQLHFLKTNGKAFAAGDKYCLRNGGMSIFDGVEVQVSDTDSKIEELRHCDHVGNLRYLVRQPKSKKLEHFGYAEDTVSEASFTNNDGMKTRAKFVKNNQCFVVVPLTEIPFFDSFTGLFTKTKFRIVLHPNYNRPVIAEIAADETVVSPVTFNISRAELFMPEVTLLPEPRAKLLQKFNSGATKRMMWQSVEAYKSQQFPARTTDVYWTVSSEIRKPSWVFFFLAPDVATPQTTVTQVYNKWNITNYTVSVNGKEVFLESNISFNSLKVQRLYESLCRKNEEHFDLTSLDPKVSYVDFCERFRILAFNMEDADASTVYNASGSQSVSLSIRMTVDSVAEPMYVYCVVEREKEIAFNYKNERVEIGFTQI
jgi:hypothetical protein